VHLRQTSRLARGNTQEMNFESLSSSPVQEVAARAGRAADVAMVFGSLFLELVPKCSGRPVLIANWG
jgi:hypothetical protein